MCSRSSIDTFSADNKLRVSSQSGKVEIFHQSTWVGVCGNYYTDEEARVVCRAVGLGSTGLLRSPDTGHVIGSHVKWYQITCGYEAEGLEDCSVVTKDEKCNGSVNSQLFVHCGGKS